MKTRFEQITKKIALSKAIDMNYLLWETTIDDNTLNKLKDCGYHVEKEYFNSYYYICW